MRGMKQTSLGLSNSVKRTRKREFLDSMERVVPWAELVSLITPYAHVADRRGRKPFAVEAMLRIHFMQQWFTLSDPAMEEALHDTPLLREFAGLGGWEDRLPDESTILRFRHLLEKHQLAEQIFRVVNDLLSQRGLLLRAGTAVDATLIAAPTSTKNASGKRDPQMHSSKKANQWYFGAKAHIGVDAESGLVHTMRCTSGNVSDVVEGNRLLHGQERQAFGDAGYRGVQKREDANPDVKWNIAMGPGKRAALDKATRLGQLSEELEKLKASVRAKVEHPFRVIKRQFGYVKVRYRGLGKNAAQMLTLFALSNLWMVRNKIGTLYEEIRPMKA
jgi:IS5 family transposase